jgi:SAM-dependent methyltransferase
MANAPLLEAYTLSWMRDMNRAQIEEYYARGGERGRLDKDALGELEFERTKEILARRLPAVPSVVADIGGGPGRYTCWLAGLGYRVEHRDLMPFHVEQLMESLAETDLVRSLAGDARELDLADASVDAVLLLGPLYHLRRRADRIRALREAARIVRPGGPVFVAVISRFAPRLDAVLRERLDLAVPALTEGVAVVERTGFGAPLFPGDFTAYFHRPAQLRQEVRAAGLRLADLVSVEGPASLLGDLAERLADPGRRDVVFETARATERVPELLGIGPHLIATGVRQA